MVFLVDGEHDAQPHGLFQIGHEVARFGQLGRQMQGQWNSVVPCEQRIHHRIVILSGRIIFLNGDRSILHETLVFRIGGQIIGWSLGREALQVGRDFGDGAQGNRLCWRNHS